MSPGLEKYYGLINEAKSLKNRVQRSLIYKEAVQSAFLQQDHCQMILINEFLKSKPDSSSIIFLSKYIEFKYPSMTNVFKDGYWNDSFPNSTKYIEVILPTDEIKTQRFRLYLSLMKLSADIRDHKSNIDTALYNQFRVPYQSGTHYIDSLISEIILNDIANNGYPEPKKDSHQLFSAFYYCCLHQSYRDSTKQNEFWKSQKNAVENGYISNNQYAYLIDHTFVNKFRAKNSRYFVLLSGSSCTIKDVTLIDFEQSQFLRKELFLPTLCDELQFVKSDFYLNLPKYCK